jgi:Nif-specific ferredoxin III
MATLTGTTQGGLTWEPKFVQEIDPDKCIGCGRCFKVCGRGILELQALNEDGEFIDEDDGDITRKVMTIANGQLCIGCQACSRICPKNCYTHAAINN